MLRTAHYRNSLAFLRLQPIALLARYRRLLFASSAAVCIGMMVLPALPAAEPKAVPPPRAEVPDISGALVIVGGGGLPDVIRDRFLKLAGGKNGRLVFIPTASERADRLNIYPGLYYWKAQGLASVSMLNTLDPNQANDPAFVKPLTEATAVWLDGGDQSRLAKAYRGTAVERELRRLLAHGGVIGGTSAGASVMSSIMITGGFESASVGDGFGLLPGVVIDQHFRNRKRQKRLFSVLEKHPSCLGLGIDENTAVVVEGHKFTVLGKGNVSVCMPRDEGRVTLLKAEEVGDLLQLSGNVMARLRVPTDTKPVAAKTSRATMP